MTARAILILVSCLTAAFSSATLAFAAGGTSTIASKGRAAYVSPGWAEGVGELVNDESRTAGWNSWFSSWPNDVNQYAFEIQSTDDLNRLIAKLAAIKSDLRQIRLSYLKEPKGLGWTTRVPEGNGIPVIFSVGDQSRIDQWYEQLRQPFGTMEFTAAPVAVPPTLTIFVQNEAVTLKDLIIPEGIDVSAGYVPTVFHKSNTTLEQLKEKEASSQAKLPKPETLTQNLDDASLAAWKEIEQFLETRRAK